MFNLVLHQTLKRYDWNETNTWGQPPAFGTVGVQIQWDGSGVKTMEQWGCKHNGTVGVKTKLDDVDENTMR